jgi:cytochrome c oxidase assembly factor CtaG
MTRPWGHMGCSMIENDKRETNNSILSERQEYVFKAAVLILCAGILAMVLFSGAHETRTADQCGQTDARAACQALSTSYPAYPAKGGIAPFGAGAVDRHAGN